MAQTAGTLSMVPPRDGTKIAVEKAGTGPALVIVDGAMCSRAFGPSEATAAALSRDFTIYRYDRRGRGDSTDTPPYAVEREVEDLAAVVAEAGGWHSCTAISSGAGLALEAAASGAPMSKLASVARKAPVADVGDLPVERRFDFNDEIHATTICMWTLPRQKIT